MGTSKPVETPGGVDDPMVQGVGGNDPASGEVPSAAEAGSGSGENIYAQVRDTVGTVCGTKCVELAEQVVEKGDACISEMPTVNISGIGEVPAGYWEWFRKDGSATRGTHAGRDGSLRT